MFKYLLSNLVDYSLLICDDAGPGYAANMNWETIVIENIDAVRPQEVLIIDPRIQEHELEAIELCVSKNNKIRFFFRVADPYTEVYQKHFYYIFLKKIAKYNNVYLLSTYEPRELVIDLEKHYFAGRFLHLPYPYLKNKEIHHKKPRKNKIILSGSVNQDIYPYRTGIWRKVTRSLLRFLFFDILQHPGYIEITPNDKHKHAFIKQEFINYLSEYKYMLLCPSRCGIEFLKFNECAYAGCVPIGLAPDSYPTSICSFFSLLRNDFLLIDTIKIIIHGYKRNTVNKIRKFLQDTRNPAVLNETFKKFIIENSIYPS